MVQKEEINTIKEANVAYINQIKAQKNKIADQRLTLGKISWIFEK